jgi:hypothetical protein
MYHMVQINNARAAYTIMPGKTNKQTIRSAKQCMLANEQASFVPAILHL